MDYLTLPFETREDCLLTPVDDETRKWLCVQWLVTTYASECEPSADHQRLEDLINLATCLVENTTYKAFRKPQWTVHDPRVTRLWEAMQVVKLNEAGDPPTITYDLVMQLHQTLFPGDEDAGKLRTVNVGAWGTDVVYAPHWSVGRMLRTLMDTDRYAGIQQLDPKSIMQANVRFYSAFLKIHPFCDGNGRMARLLFAVAMKQHFPILFAPKAHGKEREGFLSALADSQRVWQEGGRFHTLYWLFLEAASRMAAEVNWINA
jgi:fido (protein-threonine AMPylation protein)